MDGLTVFSASVPLNVLGGTVKVFAPLILLDRVVTVSVPLFVLEVIVGNTLDLSGAVAVIKKLNGGKVEVVEESLGIEDRESSVELCMDVKNEVLGPTVTVLPGGVDQSTKVIVLEV